jgi:arylsulfatase A-like enzyme
VLAAAAAVVATGFFAAVAVVELPGHTPVTAEATQPLAATPTTPTVAGAPRPNIIAIMADDMRVDDLRWMPRTSRLLGGQGVTFANSFSPYPLCCPARASFLSGEYAHNHQVWSHKAPYGFGSFDDRSTLPVWLQGAGYQTGFVGKYLNGYGKSPTQDGRPSLSYVPPGWDDWRASVEGLGRHHPLAGGTYNYLDTTMNVNGSLVGNEGVYQTPMFTDHVIEMIDAFTHEKDPYFIWASYVAPHHGKPHERDDPPKSILRSDGSGTSKINTPARPKWVRGRFDDQIRTPPGWDPREDVSEKPGFISNLPRINRVERRAIVKSARQRAETLHILDLQVQRIVDELRARGQLDDTVIAFTSDNGYLLGEHRIRQGKILPYEPSLRVPLLMRGPGLGKGRTRYSPVTTLDAAPTFAALAGVQPGSSVDGRSVLGIVARDRGWRTGVVTETGARSLLNSGENEAGFGGGARPRLDPDDPRFSLGLRVDRWLYVRHQSGEHELYDMRTDPRQRVNLAGRPAFADVRRELQRELDRLRDCAGIECRQPLAPSLQVATEDIVSGR